MKRILGISMVLFGVLALAGCGVVPKNINAPANNKAPANATQAVPSAVDNEIKDWETYRNDRHGFEFTYPALWSLVKELQPGPLDYRPYIISSVAIYPTENQQDYSAYIDIYNAPPAIVLQSHPFLKNKTPVPTTFNNIAWNKVGDNDYLVEKNGKTFNIGGQSDLVKQILSTFRFTSDLSIPYIGSIFPSSAPVGTTIEVRGSGFLGFESDVYFFFERPDGKTIRLPGIVSYEDDPEGAQTARVLLKEPCQKGDIVYGDYSGITAPCDYVQLTPGVYKVFTIPWGTKSNEVSFTVTAQDETADWKTYQNKKYGYEIKYPTNAVLSSPNTSLVVKEFSPNAPYITIKVGSAFVSICDAKGEPCGGTGVGTKAIFGKESIILDGKTYKASGHSTNDKEVTDKIFILDLPAISIVYGYRSEYGKPLTVDQIREAEESAKKILSTFKFTK